MCRQMHVPVIRSSCFSALKQTCAMQLIAEFSVADRIGPLLDILVNVNDPASTLSPNNMRNGSAQEGISSL